MNLSTLVKVTEGTTELLVPDTFCERGPGTKTRDVFYNKQMEFSRDISVIFGRETFREGNRILDGLAATGARGLRLANETGVKAEFVLNDRSLPAAVLMKENAAANSLQHIRIECKDLRVLLAEEQFDYIDVDPFGTPVEFVNAAIQSCRNKGIVALTATDTAPLYGTYPKTCLRRYGALSARSPFAHETGLRILIGYAMRQAAMLDRSFEPLLCYHADHYFRCYLRLVKGATRADTSIRGLGYARFDKGTLSRSFTQNRECGADAGPLWGGGLCSKKILESMSSTKDLGTSARCEKLLGVLREEVGSPSLFFKLDEFARMTKHSPPKLSELVQTLRDSGHSASKTHFDPKGFKTDADIAEIVACFTSL